jgi:hypothetical protein
VCMVRPIAEGQQPQVAACQRLSCILCMIMLAR